VLVWGERDDAVPEFADAIGPHKGLLALHAKCTGDELRRNQLVLGRLTVRRPQVRRASPC
jgi:hypothetical protein